MIICATIIPACFANVIILSLIRRTVWKFFKFIHFLIMYLIFVFLKIDLIIFGRDRALNSTYWSRNLCCCLIFIQIIKFLLIFFNLFLKSIQSHLVCDLLILCCRGTSSIHEACCYLWGHLFNFYIEILF